jgi:hypothetical protein
MLALPMLAIGAARAEFTEVGVESGLSASLPTWGAQAIDIDRDGDIDFVSGHHFYTVTVFGNDGTGLFSADSLPQIVIPDAEDRHGLVWADLNGDVYPDAVCSHGGGGGCGCDSGSNELWRSVGGATSFTLVGGAGGMVDAAGRGRAFSAADIDGDGDLDLFHGKAPLVASPNSLYRNDGALTFVDVATAWGIDETEGTVGGLFADYDDDGDPDLLVGGEEFTRSTRLWRNDGGTFLDVTASALGAMPVIAGADFGDLDGDGDLDLVVCEGNDAIFDTWDVVGKDLWFFANHRLDDDGVDYFRFSSVSGNPVAILEWSGTFAADRIFLGPTGVHPVNPVILLDNTLVGAPSFTPGVDEGMYVWRESVGGRFVVAVTAPPGTFGNYSGDIFTGSGIAAPSDSLLEQAVIPPAGPRVFRNDGGTFLEITETLGLSTSANPRAVSWVDFDNDGDLDLHQVNKGTAQSRGEADLLWRNDGGTFSALSGPGWVDGDPGRLTDGGVWADADGDGDLDLFLQEGTGPDFFATEAPTLLYRNDGPAGNWLALSLGETLSGGTAVGARATCYAGSLVVHRRVRADSWRGFQGPLSLHFGLGDATAVDSLVVEWPGASTQVLGPLPVNASFSLSEGDDPGAVGAPVIASGGFFVGRISPQPARGAQEVLLRLSRPGHVRVTIHDVTGRRLGMLLDASLAPGETRVRWDGRDAEGRPVPAGVYFLRGTGDVAFQRKAVRLR